MFECFEGPLIMWYLYILILNIPFVDVSKGSVPSLAG